MLGSEEEKARLTNKHFGHLPKYQVKKEDALLGKEIRINNGIRKDWSEGTIAFLFTDGTFAVFEVTHDTHDSWGEINIMSEPVSPSELLGLELVSREEYDAYLNDFTVHGAGEAKQRRYERYLELEQEFGGDN